MEDSNELISIIVPIYNVERYFRRCIDSIINQTYKNLEIILVDDGSPDACPKLCDEYSKIDKRIKVIHKKNGGLSDARNVGIDICKGNYITFVDSDDWIEKDMIEQLYSLINKFSADISICNFLRTSDEKMKIFNKNEKIKCYNKYEAIRELLKGHKIQDYAWNKMYKKEVFYNIRYPKGRNMEDKGTTYKTFLLSTRIVTTSNCYYYYFDRSDSIINRINYKLLDDEINLCAERYEILKKLYPNMKENYKYIYSYLVKWTYTALKNNDKDLYKLMYKNFDLINRKFYFVNLKTTIKTLLIRKERNEYKTLFRD